MTTPSTSFSRRSFLIASASAAILPAARAADAKPFSLPDLPYPKDALEPFIDAETMGIHHGQHHNTYVTNLNKAVADLPNAPKSLDALISDIPSLDKAAQTAVRNHGGGHYNHTLFWQIMGKPGAKLGGSLAEAITKTFGSLDAMKAKFSEAATKRFGSGWAWLIVKSDGALAITSTPNQDNPLMKGLVPDADLGKPILGLDVWEHAYYLKYRSARPKYIEAWWNVVNWEAVAKRFAEAK